MKIKVNGKSCEVPDGITVGELLNARQARAAQVVVALNLAVIDRRGWDGTPLQEGDAVEIITFLAGG